MNVNNGRNKIWVIHFVKPIVKWLYQFTVEKNIINKHTIYVYIFVKSKYNNPFLSHTFRVRSCRNWQRWWHYYSKTDITCLKAVEKYRILDSSVTS